MAHNKPRLLSVLLLALVRPVTPLRAPAAAPRALLGHVRPAAPVPSSLRLGSAPTLLASKKEDTAPIVDIADPNVSIVFASLASGSGLWECALGALPDGPLFARFL